MATLLARATVGHAPPALEWGRIKCDYQEMSPRRFQRRRTARIIRRTARFAVAEGLQDLLAEYEELRQWVWLDKLDMYADWEDYDQHQTIDAYLLERGLPMKFPIDDASFNVLDLTLLGMIHWTKTAGEHPDCFDTTRPDALRFEADLIELRDKVQQIRQSVDYPESWRALTNEDIIDIVRAGEKV